VTIDLTAEQSKMLKRARQHPLQRLEMKIRLTNKPLMTQVWTRRIHLPNKLLIPALQPEPPKATDARSSGGQFTMHPKRLPNSSGNIAAGILVA